jgi:sulfate transport system substrate-binding protein
MAQKKDLPVDIVTPPQSILIENPIAVTTETKFKKQANAFVQYLYTPAAQAIWAQNGYWPVVQSVLKRFHFANPHTLFTIRSLGGWTRVYRQFFSPGGSIMLSIERKKGINP